MNRKKKKKNRGVHARSKAPGPGSKKDRRDERSAFQCPRRVKTGGKEVEEGGQAPDLSSGRYTIKKGRRKNHILKKVVRQKDNRVPLKAGGGRNVSCRGAKNFSTHSPQRQVVVFFDSKQDDRRERGRASVWKPGGERG